MVDSNVAKWLGTAAATPTIAGVPEVDVTHLSGASTIDTIALLTAAQYVVNRVHSKIVASESGGTVTEAIRNEADSSDTMTYTSTNTGRVVT